MFGVRLQFLKLCLHHSHLPIRIMGHMIIGTIQTDVVLFVTTIAFIYIAQLWLINELLIQHNYYLLSVI